VAHRAASEPVMVPPPGVGLGSSNPTLLPLKEGAAPFTLTTLSLIVAFPPANDLPFHETVSFTGRSSRPEARCSHRSRRTCR